MTDPTTRARWAVTAVFAANGMLIASMAVRTPSLALDLGLTTTELGLTSAVFGIAAVAAMQVTGRLAARFGSAVLVRITAPLAALALVGVGVAPDLLLVCAAFLAFGAVHGTLDVSLNAHAVAVERRRGRPVLNSCHAAWSLGSVSGSLLGSGAAAIGLSRGTHFAVVAAALVIVLLVTGRMLLPADVDRRDASSSASGKRVSPAWSPRLVALGLLGALLLTCEGAVISWSGVYLHDVRGASLGVAGLGFVAFSATQTLMRLVGDRVQERLSAGRLVTLGTLLGAAGYALALAAPDPVLSLVGFGVLGVGLATPLPVLYGVVGRLGTARGGPTGAAAAVAGFTTMTYAGILLAPPAIGAIAHGVGLAPTLAALVPLLLVVAASAGRLTRPPVAADDDR